MDIRRQLLPPQEAAPVARPVAVPTLSIALTIPLPLPLPLAWPRRRPRGGAGLPEDAALACIELAFGRSSDRPRARHPGRRVGRRRAPPVVRVPPHALATAPLSFAAALRQAGWWRLALSRLGQRTRRLQVLRLLPL